MGWSCLSGAAWMYSSSDCRAITSSGSGSCSLDLRKSWEKMSRICSRRKLVSRPFFSLASVRMEKWAELVRIHLGLESRVDPTEEVANARKKTAERIHLGWEEMLCMFDRM